MVSVSNAWTIDESWLFKNDYRIGVALDPLLGHDRQAVFIWKTEYILNWNLPEINILSLEELEISSVEAPQSRK